MEADKEAKKECEAIEKPVRLVRKWGNQYIVALPKEWVETYNVEGVCVFDKEDGDLALSSITNRNVLRGTGDVEMDMYGQVVMSKRKDRLDHLNFPFVNDTVFV
jgi:hypothetical protein